MLEFPDPPRGDTPPVEGYPEPDAPAGSDPVGIAAIVSGCVGLVFLGIVFAILTAFLAGVAGQRARERGTSPENAYIAFVLAAVDGIAWLVLHMIFALSFLAG